MTTREVEIPEQWNCPKLKAAVEAVTGTWCEVAWCHADGKYTSRSETPNPHFLTVSIVNDTYREDHLRKLRGFVSARVIGQKRMDGPSGFVIIESETTFLKVIFAR